MKRRWLGIAICAAVLLAAGCSSGTDVSRAADASAVKAAPVEKKKVYVSPDWVQSVLDGNQEESEDYMVLECAWGTVQDAAAYKEGHIKGAYHMNTDDIESEEYWNIRTPEEIKDLMAEYGITKIQRLSAIVMRARIQRTTVWHLPFYGQGWRM